MLEEKWAKTIRGQGPLGTATARRERSYEKAQGLSLPMSAAWSSVYSTEHHADGPQYSHGSITAKSNHT